MKNDRHWQMKELFLQRHRMTNGELKEIFGVSMETVRRDLALLEQEGLVRRVYGGAVLAEENLMPMSMASWNTRVAQNLAQKRAIAQELVRYVPDDATIVLDSGTTICEAAKLLNARKNLTIITNCVYSAAELNARSEHKVYFIGGALKKDEMICTGFFAQDFLSFFSHFDLALVGTDGFDVREGLTDFDLEMGRLKRMMIERSSRVFAAADASKFGVNALCKTCPSERLDLLVTDADAPKESLDYLREKGVRVITVPVVSP